MDSIPYYFSHARTALKFGLLQLGIKRNDSILIPDYFCDVVLQPLDELGIEYRYYSIDDDLTLRWAQLENLLDKKTKAIFMVHYFGQPQNIEKFQNFCKKHKLLLIEDNAHGHGGTYEGKFLGTFGDIGISSPRKFLTKTYSGGILWLKHQNLDVKIEIPEYPISNFKRLKKSISNTYPSIRNIIKKVFKERPKYEDPRAFREPILPDYKIDIWSKDIINKNNWDDLRNRRQVMYHKKENIALQNGFKPVFSKLHPEANPWCFPAYIENENEAVKWYKWGWENNLRIFSWPSLPEEIIKLKTSALNRYNRLVCFSIDI